MPHTVTITGLRRTDHGEPAEYHLPHGRFKIINCEFGAGMDHCHRVHGPARATGTPVTRSHAQRRGIRVRADQGSPPPR